MSIIIYILRCIFILLITWTGIRFIGKKSIAEMTSYDLVALILLTTMSAEPLSHKSLSKTTIGVFSIVGSVVVLSILSLKGCFYNIDSKPTLVIVDGMIMKKELKKVRMNIPLLMSEIRTKGYQNLSDIRYAIIESSGKVSIIPKSQTSAVTPEIMGIPSPRVNLSLPLIIDGEVSDENLKFLNKDRKWLLRRLQAFEVADFNNVLIAQYDSSGQLFVNIKNKNNKEINIPPIL